MKIPAINQNQLIAGVVVVAVLFVFLRGFKGAAKDLTKGAVNLAGGAVEGVTVGIGDIFGVPETSQTQCEKDIAEGNNFASSFSCPAGTFIKGLFS